MIRGADDKMVIIGMVALIASCVEFNRPHETELAPRSFQNCHTQAEIQICIEKEVYSPLEGVPYTIANGTTRSVYEDRCSGGLQGRRSAEDGWSGSYGVIRICHHFGDEEDLAASRRLIPAGGLVVDTLHVNNAAYEGDWRIWLRLLDSHGSPIRAELFTSPVFRVER